MSVSVYVIQSQLDYRLYKGLAKDIHLRLKEHNSGKNFSTKPYKPWTLVFSQEFDDLKEARRYEKYLKSGAGRKFLKMYLEKRKL
ncbi:MAG TPA: GIY-YIG nuclease family protein [Bacteroidales bacterium]|nr:GIY-YIG nuclease family protein [Bacteroidales bacterium]